MIQSQITLHVILHNEQLIDHCCCGVVKPSNPHPPLVLGLRPMPRPVIAYEEDRGDHGNPKNRAEDNFVLG